MTVGHSLSFEPARIHIAKGLCLHCMNSRLAHMSCTGMSYSQERKWSSPRAAFVVFFEVSELQPSIPTKKWLEGSACYRFR